MGRQKSILLLCGLAVVVVSSCSPYNYNGSGIQLAFENSKVIMVDAPQVSCRSAHSTTPVADLNSISMDLGRIAMTWTVPSGAQATATLKLIYISIRLRTSGLQNLDTPIIIAGQDLNCIVKDNPDTGATLSVSNGGVVDGAATTPFTFPFELRVGGFSPVDSAKKTSFGGSASALIYGLIHNPPNQDQPVIGRASFQFNFGGILQ